MVVCVKVDETVRSVSSSRGRGIHLLNMVLMEHGYALAEARKRPIKAVRSLG